MKEIVEAEQKTLAVSPELDRWIGEGLVALERVRGPAYPHDLKKRLEIHEKRHKISLAKQMPRICESKTQRGRNRDE